MMCCVGLMGGAAVGQALGGPWTWIGPAAGFGIGLVADMKMMKGHAKADAEPKAPDQGAAAVPAAQSGAGCGIASGLTRMLGSKEKKEKAEITLAEIRKTYETGSNEPPATAATAPPAAVEKPKSA